MSTETHVDDLELAAFVDGGLDPEARRRVEAHLLACDDCRGLVAAVGRLGSPPVRSARRRLMLVAGLAAAAAVVLTLVSDPRTIDTSPRTRDVEAVGPAGIRFAPEAPADGALVRADTVVFRWSKAGEEATYQLTLSSEAGAIVWTERTTATSLGLPSQVARGLEPGRLYYWSVDAVLPDLRSATTGPRRLIPVAP